MNQLMNKLVILVAVLATASMAQAKDRYLVIYKSQQGYAAMNNYMLTNESSTVKLQKSLGNINGMVLVSKNIKAIESLKNNPEVAIVEAETFTPAPKPVNGFKISHTQKIKTAFSEVTPTEPALNAPVVQVPNFQEGKATPWGILAVHAPQAWAQAQAGANARVLVLDTGIDPNHPALKANFEQGRNFFENYDGPNPNDFIDEEGHGTHCSGTIAGVYNEQTGFTGVAPLAKLLMGRVCGELGCSNIAVADGINWGIQLKVDVISMSLGGPYGTSAERMAVANAEKAGVVVVAASGNGGNAAVSYPAAFPTAIAVGAIDSSIKKTNFSQWGPELDIMAPGAAVVSTVPQGAGRDSTVDLTVNGVVTRVNSAAFFGTKLISIPKSGELVAVPGMGTPEDFAKVNVEGKLALVSRGIIAFADKVKNAQAAKAIGIILYNNTAGVMQGVAAEGPEIEYVVVMIEQAVGQQLVADLANGAKTSAEVSTSASDYAMYDGTSMATPHVAGVVALIKSANKKLTPAQVRTIIGATALPLGPNTANEYGAGLIQADKAVQMAAGM